ncbi:hypothetical protein AA637_02855 [Cyanobacterium sp. HL-69]|nr:hypothetical protein [Cyanobacterium sp. IPPAS B-1200]AUC60156.1 hypothetical protein AA637_02855 [Cyanobacterium sp. HL-69]
MVAQKVKKYQDLGLNLDMVQKILADLQMKNDIFITQVLMKNVK